ncbi:hypothetical protein RvY_11089 [Ramazzottius varieornatus]|uniref:Uncharacterized protein n=1 Tax=Ramazzottius varieornatus TaxID=947166 RepID=A0A1D1VEY9_RAMVA|nr:hypothetical protein RvY_11089 [Ramazzottius varieornatus]
MNQDSIALPRDSVDQFSSRVSHFAPPTNKHGLRLPFLQLQIEPRVLNHGLCYWCTGGNTSTKDKQTAKTNEGTEWIDVCMQRDYGNSEHRSIFKIMSHNFPRRGSAAGCPAFGVGRRGSSKL